MPCTDPLKMLGEKSTSMTCTREIEVNPELTIKLDYSKNNNPIAIFEAISLYIKAYKEFGQLMTNSIGIKEKFEFNLTGVEVSSILSKLVAVTNFLDSSCQKTFYSAGNQTFCELANIDRTESEEEVERLASILESKLSEGMPNQLVDPHVDRQALAYVLQSFSNANSSMSKDEAVVFNSPDTENAKCNFNTNWRFTGNPSEMFQGKTTPHINNLLLQVKVPVNEGMAAWTFKCEKLGQSFSARIIDSAWLEKYQNGFEPLNPLDIIEAEVSYDIYEPPKGKGTPVIRNAKIKRINGIQRFTSAQYGL